MLRSSATSASREDAERLQVAVAVELLDLLRVSTFGSRKLEQGWNDRSRSTAASSS